MLLKKKTTTTNKGPCLIQNNAPFEYVEAYKALRTNFNFVTANNNNRRIVLTSSLCDEGKSSLAINLAIALAQTDNKVLLIDADMRNPSLHRYLNIPKNTKQGLSNLLSGNVKVGDCLINTEYGFDLIAGGLIPPNPAELIASDAMRDLLNVAAKHYDYIICDAPPVGIITDAAALSPLCDGVLYIIRQKYASKYQVHDAIRKLRTVNANILGVVLTQCKNPHKNRYKYGRSGYGYGYRYRYGYRYGYGYSNQQDGTE